MKVKNILKSFFSMFLILTILITSGLPVSASVKFPTGRETEWSENNILFYNPNGCTTSFTGGPTPSGENITWIGDSYSVGAQQVGLLDSVFPGVDYGGSDRVNAADSYIEIGKKLMLGDSSNPSGLDVLKSIPQESIRDYLVFALGTNDYEPDGETSVIDEVESIIGSERTLILVAPADAADGAYGRGEIRKFDKVIAIFEEAQSKYGNINIADWPSVAKAEYFADDGDRVHPFGHYDVWVESIRAALAGGSSSEHCDDDCFPLGTILDANGAQAIVLNWFLSHPESQISSNMEAIAGVMGNLQAESGFNPFARSSAGYYGIYQTKGDGLKEAIDARGWANYWGSDIGSIPPEVLKGAIETELEVLVHAPRWGSFTRHLSSVSNTSGTAGARAYADLAMVTVEIAFCSLGGGWNDSNCNPIEDPGVRQIASHERWQHLEKRRGYAEQLLGFTGSSGGIDPCDIGIGQGNGDINRTAISLAWPNRGHDWRNPKPEYKAAMEQLGLWGSGSDEHAKIGASCDMYVATVMRYSGVDTNFPPTLGNQKSYLMNHPEKYTAISAGNTSPQPGDIHINASGSHIIIIIKVNDHFEVASASNDHTGTDNLRTAEAGVNYGMIQGTIYRYKGASSITY